MEDGSQIAALDLSWNNCTQRRDGSAIVDFCAALAKNTTLKSFSLAWNAIGGGDIEIQRAALDDERGEDGPHIVCAYLELRQIMVCPCDKQPVAPHHHAG